MAKIATAYDLVLISAEKCGISTWTMLPSFPNPDFSSLSPVSCRLCAVHWALFVSVPVHNKETI